MTLPLVLKTVNYKNTLKNELPYLINHCLSVLLFACLHHFQVDITIFASRLGFGAYLCLNPFQIVFVAQAKFMLDGF
jgi:hypothetical protein